MPIVPSGNVLKSIAVGTPYSPAVSFNPDKKDFFDTDSTVLGVLGGPAITTDGTQVTVPSGFMFIQNGIIVKLTAPFLVTIPVTSFPKYLMASNADENPGSAVTISFQPSPVAPNVLIATLNPDNFTLVFPEEVSIRGLSDRIDDALLDVQGAGVDVVSPTNILNFDSENLIVAKTGPKTAQVQVLLDILESLASRTSRTKQINFEGATVTPDTPNAATVDVTKAVDYAGSPIEADCRTLDFEGEAVAVTNPTSKVARATILAGTGMTTGGIVDGDITGDGGTRQINTAGLSVLIDGRIIPLVDAAYAVTANSSGNPRTDLVQFDGVTLSVKPGTPGSNAPCPAPDTDNIPIAIVLVPDSSANLVDEMDSQAATINPVIVAYYYANGGLIASRVGVTSDPTTTSSSYVIAPEMAISAYFTKPGRRYEMEFDTEFQVGDGSTSGLKCTVILNVDGSNAADAFARSGQDLQGSNASPLTGELQSCYRPALSVGEHHVQGRFKQDAGTVAATLTGMRRRLQIREIA